jgi:hypothetical protein
MAPPAAVGNAQSTTYTGNTSIGKITLTTDEQGKTTVLFQPKNKPAKLAEIIQAVNTFLRLRHRQVDGSTAQVINANSIRNPEKIMPRQVIVLQVTEFTGGACPAPTDPAVDRVEIGKSGENPKPIYEGTGQRDETTGQQKGSLKAKQRYYVHDENAPHEVRKFVVEKVKIEFSQAIFEALKKAGIIRSDVPYTKNIGRKIAELVRDEDFSGYFSFDVNKLQALLKKHNLLTESQITIADALSDITNRYMKNERPDRKVVEYYAAEGARGKELIRLEEAFAELNRTNPAPPITVEHDRNIGRLSAGQFCRYLTETYTRGGRSILCGNVELQRRLAHDIDVWMKARVTGAYDVNGNQINIRQDFRVTIANLCQLSQDSDGKYRVNCSVAAQLAAIFFRAACLDVHYFGSTLVIKENGQTRYPGHVQAVGYIAGADFIIANNNEHVGLATNASFSKAAAQKLVVELLGKNFSQNEIGNVTPVGLKDLRAVSAFLSREASTTIVRSTIMQNYKLSTRVEAHMRQIGNYGADQLKGMLKRLKQEVGELKRLFDLVEGVAKWPIEIELGTQKRKFENKQQLIDYLKGMIDKYNGWIGQIDSQLRDMGTGLDGRISGAGGKLTKGIKAAGEKVKIFEIRAAQAIIPVFNPNVLRAAPKAARVVQNVVSRVRNWFKRTK